MLGWFFDPGRLSESDAHKRHTTTRGTTQRGHKWAMVTDWALAATALACATATEIAWLASKDLFFNQFANTSAAPSRPSATQTKSSTLTSYFGRPRSYVLTVERWFH